MSGVAADHRGPTAGVPPVAPAAVLAEFLARFVPRGTEAVPLAQAAGRVLAEPVIADRDSPPADVSAMDGFAVCGADLAQGAADSLPVIAESRIGRAPPAARRGGVVRIATGAPLPVGADAVVVREVVQESAGHVTVPAEAGVARGQHVRRAGENIRAGSTALSPGIAITPPVAALLASFGVATPRVYRRVRVGLLVTGDELLDTATATTDLEAWQLRDANGPALVAMLSRVPWVEIAAVARVPDELAPLAAALADRLGTCDAVLLTGGVSRGDRDYVPAAVTRAGGQVAFHRLPIRPGKPLLGACDARGRAILGLPGNPVSVLTTARRFGGPVLRKLAGFSAAVPPVPQVLVPEGAGGAPDKPPLALWWHRLVRLTSDGCAALVPTRGSGDSVSAARSDGFIEVPPCGGGCGPWPFYGWYL